MKPGRLDLPVVWRGCDWPAITLKWKNPDGTPFDLTGWHPIAYSRSNTSLNATVTDRVGGVTQISLNRTQTAAMNLGNEAWDWVWYDGNANIAYPPILAGMLFIDQPTVRTTGNPLAPIPPP